MNILRIVPYFKCEDIDIYQNSGFSQTIYELNKSQIAKGDKVFLLSNYRISYIKGDFEIINPIKFIQISIHSILIFLKLFNTKYYNFKLSSILKDLIKMAYASVISDVIKKKKIDVVHVHSLDKNVLMYLSALNQNNIKFVLTLHYSYTDQDYFLKKDGFNKLLKCNYILTTISTQLKNNIKYLTEIDIKVINNGIIKDEQLATYERSEFLEFTKNKDDVFLLFAGSLIERKNPSFLVRALGMLPDKYKLVICGEGTLKEELLYLIDHLKLTERVLLLGYVQHKYMSSIFRNVNVLCVVSKSEAFGRMVVEANAVGTPCLLFSDLEAVKDFSNLSGVKFIKRLGPKDYANEIIAFNNTNNQLDKYKIISDVKPFYWENIIEKYYSLYKQYLIS